MELAARCLGIAQKRLGARQRLAAFKSGDRVLAGSHSGRQFGLRESRAQASPEQLGGDLELRSECIVLGFDLRIGQQAGFELLEWDRNVTSLARLNASSISERGVFCVFFSNANYDHPRSE